MRALLDDGLDELAAKTYQGFPLRMSVTAMVAALASLELPWRVCVVFLVLAINVGDRAMEVAGL